MVKILYLIVWETSDKSYCVYTFFDLYLFGFSLDGYVFSDHYICMY